MRLSALDDDRTEVRPANGAFVVRGGGERYGTASPSPRRTRKPSG